MALYELVYDQVLQEPRSGNSWQPTLFEFAIGDCQSREGVFQQGQEASWTHSYLPWDLQGQERSAQPRHLRPAGVSWFLLENQGLWTTSAPFPEMSVWRHEHCVWASEDTHTVHIAVFVLWQALASSAYSKILVFISLPMAHSLVSTTNLGREEPKVLSTWDLTTFKRKNPTMKYNWFTEEKS